jgi:hypothetical protein
MLVLVEDAAEAVTSVDRQMGNPVRIGDRFGQRREWPGVHDALMRPVSVVEGLELAQRVQQMSLVEDQRPVEQLAPACTHPAFHHGIHPGNADAAAHDRDPGVGEDGVEQGRVLAVPIPDEVLLRGMPAAGRRTYPFSGSCWRDEVSRPTTDMKAAKTARMTNQPGAEVQSGVE